MNMECRARDETFCLGQYHPWRPASADAPLSWASDGLAPFAGQPAADAWIGILLASATLPTSRGCEVLRPLWSEEAKHRARSFRRLASARNRLGQPAREDPVAAGVEAFAAGDLAERFRELRRGGEQHCILRADPAGCRDRSQRAFRMSGQHRVPNPHRSHVVTSL